jgi:NedA-like, galactose-binding domain
MRTVIMHFFNEEYLLPWWLAHHLPMFDHGILIDYGSTDNSADICRTLAPHWRLVRSRLTTFAALAVDFEVMGYEAELPGWKIGLNVTEFLHCGNLARLEKEIVGRDKEGAWITAAVMVDPFSDVAPVHGQGLFEQKSHGFLEEDVNFAKYFAKRHRLYHRAETGAYLVGRHGTQIPGLSLSEQPALILWYGYSPWLPAFIRRKLQIGAQVPVSDARVGWGLAHLAKAEELDARRHEMLPHVRDLSREIAVPERPVEVRGLNIALGCPARQSSIYGGTTPTAERAVSGLKHGADSFHTAFEARPWWSVDLGRQAKFDEIVVYNRLNVMCRRRSQWLQVLLSDDGDSWDLLYAHDGTPFGGIDGYPLRIERPRMSARFVKLQLPGEGFLHLDQVEIYDRGSSST